MTEKQDIAFDKSKMPHHLFSHRFSLHCVFLCRFQVLLSWSLAGISSHDSGRLARRRRNLTPYSFNSLSQSSRIKRLFSCVVFGLRKKLRWLGMKRDRPETGPSRNTNFVRRHFGRRSFQIEESSSARATTSTGSI